MVRKARCRRQSRANGRTVWPLGIGGIGHQPTDVQTGPVRPHNGRMRAAYDLAVVGAGPAGAAAALRASQLAPRAKVVLLDRAEFPRDKPCGDGISSHSIAELAVLDALDAVDGYDPVPNL